MKSRRLFLLALAATGALAMGDGATQRRNYGLVGYGINAFHPRCAFACRDSIAGATLNCSETMDMDGMDPMVMTEPDCYATDDIFLQTLAWCISSRCKDVAAWKLEKFWVENVAGTLADQPNPKETYREALEKVDAIPSVEYAGTGSLNVTSVVAEESWFAAYNTNTIFGDQETLQEKYGLVILLSGAVIPIAFSLLRFFPFPGGARSKFNAWIIDPPLFGTKHDAPVFFGLGQMPTRGQGLFIFYFIVINTVLSAVNYQYADANIWYPDNKWRWMVMLVSNRLGLLSFANMPLVFLYAGRNNILLWLTNWSHSTFLILHRWIAGIATLQAILHSIIYLDAYVRAGTHTTESKKPYWYWGIIATLGMTILFPTSILPIRRKAYELFLAWHVAISILVVAGCYWHIVFEFQHQWGYETWIIICMAVWGFDRVARLLRLMLNGIKTAEVTIIDDEYASVTVANISASGHAYLYFPTLTWRVWENHPFSVASTMLPLVAGQDSPLSSRLSSDVEKQPVAMSSPSSDSHTQDSGPSRNSTKPLQNGITFYVRTHTGTTSMLRRRTNLPILVEAGYASHSPSSLHTSPTLIALTGGVGITAVLPHLRTHPGRVKLYWGCRTHALVDAVRKTGALDGVDQEIFVGKRVAIKQILERELVRGGGEVCVLVSGPAGMVDEVRNLVGGIVSKGGGVRVKLAVESFSW
ncbi:ferric reductase-like protein transmembrane component 4 [Plenodomus tracheiphilus IPT5]|uniref:Ferric reductase-like protein transmembrane component 4 n=1 Tax=Plenodomus tracheiphilus IPT5 TaxID=1408161 RepID=A0A6A7BM03_9PLEO|nr:ferric reductase-like protein transmembrane component 4 [Plenodomus tracheiphilus IPT5]